MSSDEKTVNIPLDDPRIDKMRRNLDPDSMTDGEKYDALNMLRKCIRAQHPPEPELESGRFYLATDYGGDTCVVVKVGPDLGILYNTGELEVRDDPSCSIKSWTSIRPLVEQTPEAAAVLEAAVAFRRRVKEAFTEPVQKLLDAVDAYEKSIGGAP